MTTYPLATLAAVITDAGISAPPYSDVLLSLQASFRIIYGQDVYLGNDSQDGQWIAILARAITDANAAAIAAYNSQSPSTAKGNGLSARVKINGLRRRKATKSTADVVITGQAGTVINKGQGIDTLSQVWVLPDVVNIPPGGAITVTATSFVTGAIRADAGTINKINTPTRNWQGITNPAAATPGVAVELDGQLRVRQTASTGINALTPFEATLALVSNLPGVVRLRGYENDTDATDGDGIPRHTISIVVEGGDDQAIADGIALKKTPGAGTYGTTTIVVFDSRGVPKSIHFYRPTIVPIKVKVTLTSFAGYTSANETAIAAAVAAYGNGLKIGDDIYITKIEARTELPDPVASSTYDVTLVEIARVGDAFGVINLPITFIEAASFDVADITFVVT